MIRMMTPATDSAVVMVRWTRPPARCSRASRAPSRHQLLPRCSCRRMTRSQTSQVCCPVAKNTGTPSRKPLPRNAAGARRSPNTRRADWTMRSALPLSRSAAPIIDAIAMSTPICPQVRPNPSATSSPAGVATSAAVSFGDSPRPRAASSTMLDGVSKVTNRPHRSARGMRECAGPNPVRSLVLSPISHMGQGFSPANCARKQA